MFMVLGLLFCVWNIYQWREGTQSVNAIESKSIVIQPEKAQKMGKESIEGKKDMVKRFSTLDYDYAKGKNIATLTIPEINSNFDVFWGTDEGTLSKGVGMYVSEWTTAPNNYGGHTVLSGHRDTVFRELGELEKGDQMLLEFQGEVYSYQITKTWITDAEDRTVIVNKEHPTLTLTTCYPFDYIGNAPDRYIIESRLIK